MMDKIEGSPLAQVPQSALTLQLTRSTIKMHHAPTWVVDKTLPVEDFVLCLEGQGAYQIGGESLILEQGEAMVIPRGLRFHGRNPTDANFIGFAQHFSLSIFGQTNLFACLRLRPKVRFSNWPLIERLGLSYRQSAPASSVTLAQHHMMMVMLLTYIDEAFLGWTEEFTLQSQPGGIDLAVTVAASRIAAAPLIEGMAAKAVSEANYNADYFHREFQKRIGMTPRQFQDFKRIERAMDFIAAGHSVTECGARVGFSDPYYFSRVFKKITGVSPSEYRFKLEEADRGNLMHLDEVDQIAALRKLRRLSR